MAVKNHKQPVAGVVLEGIYFSICIRQGKGKRLMADKAARIVCMLSHPVLFTHWSAAGLWPVAKNICFFGIKEYNIQHVSTQSGVILPA